jgi:hypothetical protein
MSSKMWNHAPGTCFPCLSHPPRRVFSQSSTSLRNVGVDARRNAEHRDNSHRASFLRFARIHSRRQRQNTPMNGPPGLVLLHGWPFSFRFLPCISGTTPQLSLANRISRKIGISQWHSNSALRGSAQDGVKIKWGLSAFASDPPRGRSKSVTSSAFKTWFVHVDKMCNRCQWHSKILPLIYFENTLRLSQEAASQLYHEFDPRSRLTQRPSGCNIWST